MADVVPDPSTVPSAGAESTPGSPMTRRAQLLQWADGRSVPLRAILVTVGIVVVVYLAGKLLYRLRDVALLVFVGGFIALVLNPQVVALQRWKVRRRGAAVAIVTLWGVLIFAGLAVAFGYPLVNAVTHFANALPGYVEKAQHGKGWIGHLVRHYHIESWVHKNSPKLVSFAEGLSKPAFSLGKGALSLLASLAALFAFVVLLLLEAPRIKSGLLKIMSPQRAQLYTEMGANISRAISGYVIGDILTSIVAGVVVFVTLALLGVPYALLFGLWVALVDFLPTIGGALAGIPTVLFALGHSLTAGIVTAVVFLFYTFFENHFLNPVVMSRTVKVNPLLVFVAVLVGADIGAWIGGLFGGFVCVLLAIPVAAAIQSVIQELWQVTAPERVDPPADGADSTSPYSSSV
jgi:predicted PurR-regulated permease PerM